MRPEPPMVVCTKASPRCPHPSLVRRAQSAFCSRQSNVSQFSYFLPQLWRQAPKDLLNLGGSRATPNHGGGNREIFFLMDRATAYCPIPYTLRALRRRARNVQPYHDREKRHRPVQEVLRRAGY